MKDFFLGLIGGLAVIGIVACGNSGSSINPITTVKGAYQQIELLSRPAVKEAFENFTDHDTTNRSEPYNDNTLKTEIGTFAQTAAGRDATTAATLQAVLYPNEMVVDLSQNVPTASYLGVETGGATGSKFGGRALNDDTIDISLGALFGNTLHVVAGIPDDGKESPCLTTDHVGPTNQPTTTFPYAQAPV